MYHALLRHASEGEDGKKHAIPVLPPGLFPG
jgi:hypothetical protein